MDGQILYGGGYSKLTQINIPQIGIIHSIEQDIADTSQFRSKVFYGDPNNKIFDYYIAPDPTLILNNSLVYKMGRPLIKYENKYDLPVVPTFGSIYLATGKKLFAEMIKRVQDEYDDARIRINIPKATFAEDETERFMDAISRVELKPGIRLEVTNNYYSTTELLDFLAENTANIFFRDDDYHKGDTPIGIASSLDDALSVKRPVIVSESSMHRHILQELPYLGVDVSIKSVVEDGFKPFEKLYAEWQPQVIQWQYERIVSNVLQRWEKDKARRHTVKSRIKRLLGRNIWASPNTGWTGGKQIAIDDMTRVSIDDYMTIGTGENDFLYNRILDDKARDIYSNTISLMMKLLPNNMSKKMERANVQQAFVLDTVLSFVKYYNEPNEPQILCIGAYTDTASLSLRKMGFTVYENDPVLNYDFAEYVERPDIKNKTWDIVFSTSVIEYVENDDEFLEIIDRILRPGGVCVLTCDYRDDYKPGDPIPGCDFRMYTEDDLRYRFMKDMPNCELFGDINWKDTIPDTLINPSYGYNFATFVVKKNAMLGDTTTISRKD